MARSLKTLGIQESNALRQRVRRQHGLGRIRKIDADFLVDLLDKFEARVVSMQEGDDDETRREL